MNPLTLTQCEPPELTWAADARPLSSAFNDIYFNQADPEAESRHVFINGNDLPARWHGQRRFCIAECGFGSGLNALLSWDLWRRTRHSGQQLDYIGLEKHPFSVDQLQRALRPFTALQPLAQRLIEAWPMPICGHHLILSVPQDGFNLHLMFGDATACLQQAVMCVDAWYLDGFAPRRNPQMWSDALFTEMARLSTAQATVATFTAAAAVQRGLMATGFTVHKQPGYGRKREMITARYSGQPAPLSLHRSDQCQWAAWPDHSTAAVRRAVIVGGGIGGLSLARALRRRGIAGTVIDVHSRALQGASGNPQAIVMPALTAATSPTALFHLRAFLHALRQYPATCHHRCGVLDVRSDADARAWQQHLLALGLPEDLLRNHNGQLLYPHAGWIDTAALADAWTPCVDEWLSARVESLQQHAAGWRCLDGNGRVLAEGDVLILAAGIHTLQWPQSAALPLRARLGHTALCRAAEAEAVQRPVLLDNGHLLPPHRGLISVGSSHTHLPRSRWFDAPAEDPAIATEIARRWDRHVQAGLIQPLQAVTSRAGVRATAPDHLPLCGPVVDAGHFCAAHAELHHGRHWQHFEPAQAIPGLFVLSGLGSRGYSTAPLLADLLASAIAAAPLPIERQLGKILHPNRFLYRRMKQPAERRDD